MPKRSIWKANDGVEFEVWDLPASVRKLAAQSLGPLDRLVRVRAKGSRAATIGNELRPFEFDIPRPREKESFIETWLVMGNGTEPLRVLHVLSTFRSGRKTTAVHEHTLPRDLLRWIATTRLGEYSDIRRMLMSDLVQGVEILTQYGDVDGREKAGEVQPPPEWTDFRLHEGGFGLRQITLLLQHAHHAFARGVEWIPGPTSGVFTYREHTDPSFFFDDAGPYATIRLAGIVPWGVGQRRVVVQLVRVPVDGSVDPGSVLLHAWRALMRSRTDPGCYIDAMWVVDDHTQTDTALTAEVPGVPVAGCLMPRPAMQHNLLEQLGWAWLVRPEIGVPTEAK